MTSMERHTMYWPATAWPDWSGRTLFIDREGGIRVLLDTTESGINSADICYIRKYDMRLIPTFSDDRVVACRVVH